MANASESANRQINVEVPLPVNFTTDPATTALVVVDMENEFCHPDGGRFVGPEALDAVATAADLVDRVREAGAKVVWVRSVRDPETLEFTRYGLPPRMLRGTWACEFVDALKPLPDEPIIAKTSHDCFARTDMDAVLAEHGIDASEWTILVVGVVAQVCVHQAVLGFHSRGFQVGVVADGVAPRNDDASLAAMAVYRTRGYAYNTVVTTTEQLHFSAVPVA